MVFRCGMQLKSGVNQSTTNVNMVSSGGFSIQNGGGYQKTFLHHFVHETLQEEGTTDSDTQQVLEEQDEDAIDQQYGLLRPFVCCLDKCVHYSNTDYDLTEVYLCKVSDTTDCKLHFI